MIRVCAIDDKQGEQLKNHIVQDGDGNGEGEVRGGWLVKCGLRMMEVREHNACPPPSSSLD